MVFYSRVDYGKISDAFLQPYSPMELAVRPSPCSASGCCAGQLGRRLDLVEAKVLPHDAALRIPDGLLGNGWKWHICSGTTALIINWNTFES